MAGPVSEVAFGRAPAVLRPFVEGYTGYRFAGFRPGVHRGLPGRNLTYIISLGAPIEIAAMPDPHQPAAQWRAFVGGLHDAPATVVHDGNQCGISLDLTPLGARALFGVRAGELGGAVVGLDAVLGRRADHLVDRLASEPTWAERFAAVDDVLLSAARRGAAPPRAELVYAWRRLVASGGAVDVGALAAEVGWSRRHLGERFRAEFGLAPKVAARVVRFERARRLLERPGRPGLATVAVTTGYYDQAHMTREWRALAGCSPGTWLAEELPSVQDPAAASVTR